MLISPASVRSLKPQHIAWGLVAAAMVLTVLVYWPMLHGGYIFDDYIYFVDNTDVHVTTLNSSDWIKAALQQFHGGTNQFRALSMLSFAANYYFTGLDPFWPKLTNVAIHLLNGFLLFLLMRELFRLRRTVARLDSDAMPGDVIAAVIAAVWLLLPINFTGVAYVAQRMESLANVFIFLGLFWYFRVRRREYAADAQGGSGPMLFVCMLVSTALALGAKETGAMLPLYTACAEFSITRFRKADGALSRPALWLHGIFLGPPLIAGCAWISTWIFRSMAHSRTFTVGERLLTEPRVIMDYIGWSLAPNLNALSFYHDDIKASYTLFDPPTTLVAIITLFALLGLALRWRRSKPLFCLGVLWFFAGHVLTGTVIMLELVFEHRNYFASAGLLLAAASLLAIEPGLRLPSARAAIAGAFIAACAFTTLLRSEEWSDPLRLAYSEALKRPDSPRAQYELARTLVVAAGKDENSPLIPKAIGILERIAMRPDSGIAPLQALIFVNRRDPSKIDPRWWQAIPEKLHKRPPDSTDVGAIIFLYHCQYRSDCPKQTSELLAAFAAGLEASNGNVDLMSAYANFAVTSLDDAELSERMAREVVNKKPEVPVYRANLVRILIDIGHFDAAESEISGITPLNHGGALDNMIATLHKEVASERASAKPAPPSSETPIRRSTTAIEATGAIRQIHPRNP